MTEETSKALGKRHGDLIDDQAPSPKKTAPSDTEPPKLLEGPSASAFASQKQEDLISWPIKRLATNVNPQFLNSIISTGEGGYRVPDAQLNKTLRAYEVNLDNLRDAFASVLGKVLKTKFIERGDGSVTRATALATSISKLCSEVCISALYAKLQTIHRVVGTYKTRFGTQPTYSKDIELPLPFAIAIENFGLFESSSTETRYRVVPNFPQGNKFEGRKSDELNLLEYNSYCSLFAEIGLPMKNIDPHERKGSAWWTYEPNFDGDCYDLKITYPPLHYSDQCAVIAIMFLAHKDEDKKIRPIIKRVDDETDYGWHLKDIREGEQERAFAALAQWPAYYWN